MRWRWHHEFRSSRAHKRGNIRKNCIPILDESVSLTPLLEPRGHVSCFQNHHKRGHHVKKIVPRFLLDKSTFPSRRHSFSWNHVRILFPIFFLSVSDWYRFSRGIFGIYADENDAMSIMAFKISLSMAFPGLYSVLVCFTQLF